MYSVGHTRVLGTGVYLPENRVSSADLLDEIKSSERLGISRDWLERVTGIRERRLAPDGMKPSEMAVQAGWEALDRSGVSPADLDAVIYAGMNRDYLEPATAHIVQHRLGARNAVCFDLTNACHGFMNAIHLLDALIATGQARRGLIVTGETNWRVGRTALRLLKACRERSEFTRLVGGLTVGDAGAAMVIGPKDEPDSGFLGFMLESRGEFNQLCVYADDACEHPGHMDMVTIVKEHIQMHADMFPDFMRRLAWRPAEVRRFVHHQVGRKAFALHAEYSDIPQDRMTDTVSMLGNITSATIPVNLHRLAEDRGLGRGEKVFIAGAGSGLSVSQAGLLWQA